MRKRFRFGIKNILRGSFNAAAGNSKENPKIILAGSPNVGKSMIFYQLTGSYVTVSNYPGTTVDITKGTLNIGKHHSFEVIDTPGLYGFKTITGEEAVSKKIITDNIENSIILHIVDAKNIERMLPFTLEMIYCKIPVILVLNVYDELKDIGKKISLSHLEHDLGIPVVCTVATKGEGIENLNSRILSVAEKRYKYDFLNFDFSISTASKMKEIRNFPPSRILKEYSDLIKESEYNLLIKNEFHKTSNEIIEENVYVDETKKHTVSFKEKFKKGLDYVLTHPFYGILAALLVVYLGLFQLVGNFGAGFLVDSIEEFFEEFINPHVDTFFLRNAGSGWLFELFAGDYGIITLGLRYAIAIIFPIVGMFFLFFSLIEDSGYLPRLAMFFDRLFKKIGLNGRAVIPITLGFGCGTMATVVTRTLETKKEKVIATLLLALAIPCSAQIGVVIGVLQSYSSWLVVVWGIIIFAVFQTVGYTAARLLKSDAAYFFMELPELRIPSLKNVLVKTTSRMIWYFKEVVPYFIAASVLIWLGRITKLFDLAIKILSYPSAWIGLPEDAAQIFLFGFFRRDYGIAGLHDMVNAGRLTASQILIAAVVLTLFVPCVAQFAVIIKERKIKTALGIFLFVSLTAFSVGYILNLFLKLFA